MRLTFSADMTVSEQCVIAASNGKSNPMANFENFDIQVEADNCVAVQSNSLSRTRIS